MYKRQDDEKEESKIRGKDVANRGKELSQRKQKAIERAKEYISKAAKSKELSARDMHLALHHAVFDPECEECLGGQQRRAPHSRKGASKLRKHWFCVDTGGPVSLKTFRGERYWAGWHEEESQFEMSDPLVSKHSRNMVKSMQNFSLECGFRPDDTDYWLGLAGTGTFCYFIAALVLTIAMLRILLRLACCAACLSSSRWRRSRSGRPRASRARCPCSTTRSRSPRTRRRGSSPRAPSSAEARPFGRSPRDKPSGEMRLPDSVADEWARIDRKYRCGPCPRKIVGDLAKLLKEEEAVQCVKNFGAELKKNGSTDPVKFIFNDSRRIYYARTDRSSSRSPGAPRRKLARTP